ncbi:hypothetical protein IFR05_011107, partial [Cadophora sp. M221]
PPPPPPLPDINPKPGGGPSEGIENPRLQFTRQGNFQDRPPLLGNMMIPKTPDESVSVAVCISVTEAAVGMNVAEYVNVCPSTVITETLNSDDFEMLLRNIICLLAFTSRAASFGGYGSPQEYNPNANPPWPPVLPAPDWEEAKFFDAFTFHVAKDAGSESTEAGGESTKAGDSTKKEPRGECTEDQKNKLHAAFNQAIYLARLIYDYLSEEIRGVTTTHDVGDLMFAVFGVHPSYYISSPDGGGSYTGGEDPVTARPATELWKLQHMRGLMVLIAKHSKGELPWQRLQKIKTTRLYCDSTWLVREEYEHDDEGHRTTIKSPEGERYYDPLSNIFSPIPKGGTFEEAQGLCGPQDSDPEPTDAFTSLLRNAITFCPDIWKPDHPVLMPTAAADPARISPQPIDYFDSVSWSFLHEYTHLVGYSMFQGGVLDEINANGKEGYGFSEAAPLSYTDRAVTNADSYCLLAVGCLLKQYDWSDGFCRPGSG